jgi:2-desacetyl-2-hydroxyethyl bacteriochlorophyllide A dehydrogenase
MDKEKSGGAGMASTEKTKGDYGTMRCAVWYGGKDIRLEQKEVPTPGAEEVLIEVACCGVCGTDVHILEGKFPLFQPPRIIGHEYAGTVVAVGEKVTRVKVGDRVVAEPGKVCGQCPFCRSGRENLCLNRILSPGAFAEYTVMPQHLVYPIPDSVSLEIASLTEPLACGLHAIDLAEIPSGSAVLILGGGAIGLLLAQLSLRSGAAKVLVSELQPHRRDLARRFGAAAVDPGAEDLKAIVMKETADLGPVVTFEAIGNPARVEEAIALTQKGGKVIIVGVADPEAEFRVKPYQIFAKELSLIGSYMRPYTYPRAIAWLSQLDLEPLVKMEFGLEDTLLAIESLKMGQGVKILVKPH